MHIAASNPAGLTYCLVGLMALGTFGSPINAQTTTKNAPAKPAVPAKPDADKSAGAAGASATNRTAATTTTNGHPGTVAKYSSKSGGPKVIATGETRDQVIALLGKPMRIENLAPKEIDYYPKLKVIYVSNRVSDIQ